MSSRAEMKTFSCIFPESVLYYKSTCRCDGMVDVVDSKCVASVFPSSGKGVANSLLFWYSDSSFINIPPAYPSCFFGSVRSRVFIKVCRCVGTGRRGGLKILWANPPCGFDSRHRHQNCFDALCLFSRGLSVCRLLFNSFSKLKIDENYKEKRRLFY